MQEWIHSQIALHGRHGGVVPDLATREHLRTFPSLLSQVRENPGFQGIRRVAVTQGPGLAACLAVGVATAKAIAFALGAELLGVNHLKGHAWSPFIPEQAKAPEHFDEALQDLLPHLGLLVSGGNTLLFSIDLERRLRLLSSTRDDAAGEALDKGAKLLGLGYPGGPLVESFARKGRPEAFDFPKALGRRDDLDFSFSGLKTSLRYQIEKMGEAQATEQLADLCASYQQAVVEALVRKTRLALGRGQGPYRSLGLSGGVANNRLLQDTLADLAGQCRLPLLKAPARNSGDNAGMIAFAAWCDRAGCALQGLRLRIEPGLEFAPLV